jgi:hypothetical protein
MQPETAASGYLRERFFGQQRVADSDLWLSRDMRRVSTGERRSHVAQSLAGGFVPLISDRDAMFHSPRSQPELNRCRPKVRSGSKREELNVSKTSPLYPTIRSLDVACGHLAEGPTVWRSEMKEAAN